ncbi:MAG: SAM-dependent methyltransferase [Rhodanobacteraceae bacterium]|nr:SAM-dependent methyltransferase [Rhodanobacteraceae bacterium]
MLPEPDPHARAVSALLQDLITAEIAERGPMPFQRYMELALYAPGLGYYAAGSHKFGAQGDFVTAPELGNVFAEVVAQTLAGTLLQLAEPTLLELGAGSGALAVDLLQALARRGALPARYLILERSADLRERQRVHIAAATPQWLERIEWLEQPPEQAFDGAIIGNEVVDALACARFVVETDGPREICVDVVAGRFVAVAKEPREQLARSLANLQSDLQQPLPPGYVSEVNPELAAWFATISAPLRRGLVLLADYGYGRPEYYRAERTTGTLICHYRHHAHDDPFWHPGLNDLSASVDFTALAEAGVDSGFELLAYDNQSGFLIGAGIEGLYSHLGELDDRARLRLTQQIKRLMLPGEMGERFKVMLFGRGVEAEWLPADLAGPGQRRLL